MPVFVSKFPYPLYAFEDVEEFLDKSVVIPDKDVAVPRISVDGDVLVFRGSGALFISHVDFSGDIPLSINYTTYYRVVSLVFSVYLVLQTPEYVRSLTLRRTNCNCILMTYVSVDLSNFDAYNKI